jgi:uncharacterized protein (DUF2236 family)
MSARLFPSDAEVDGILTGPDSLSWRRTSDVRLQAVMLYPLLLQVAHPTVGAGVADYSDFEERPWDRFLRTVDYVSLLVYGGREAVAAGRRLRALHGAFKGVREDGQSYHALEPQAYAWVHATLIETYVVGHAHFGKPMRPDEIERFYAEYRGLGRLIGVRDGDLPADWSGFRSYFDGMVGHGLAHTAAVDRVMGALHRSPPPPIKIPSPLWSVLRLPAAQVLRLGGIGLMPAELRTRLEIDWSGADALQFQALGALSRSLTPVMPTRLRITGPAQLRWRREAIADGPLGG